MAAALARGVPVVSARQMLTWLDGRNASSFDGLAWAGDTLTLLDRRALRRQRPSGDAADASAPAARCQALTRGGNPVAHTTQTIKGIQYAVFDGDGRRVRSDVRRRRDRPGRSAPVAATPTGAAPPPITWTTDEPRTSSVDYGTTAGALTQRRPTRRS